MKPSSTKHIITGTFLGALFLLACTKDKAALKSPLDCNSTAYTFTADVQPILLTNCALSDCHTSAQDAGQFPLNTYDDAVFATGFDIFLKAIKHESGATPMPNEEPKLPQEEIDAIECWVLAGTPDN